MKYGDGDALTRRERGKEDIKGKERNISALRGGWTRAGLKWCRKKSKQFNLVISGGDGCKSCISI